MNIFTTAKTRITNGFNNFRESASQVINSATDSFNKSIASVIPESYIKKIAKKEIDQRIVETVNTEEEDSSWRRITANERDRDLSPLKQDKMIKIVDWLRERNPMADKIITLIADFVLGDGVKIKADKVEGQEKQQEELQEIIDNFWKMNDWELTQFDKVEELSAYGEQIYQAHINDMNGDVLLSPIPPEMINKVKKDKKFHSKLDQIIFYSRARVDGKKLDIIASRPKKLENGKEQVKHGKELQGEVFFFTINRGTFGTRGKSDILSLADWLDIYDRTLYTMTERVVFLLTFLWDIEIQGAGKEELTKRRDELQKNPPQPGSFNFHNEREKWEATSPSLNGSDFKEYFKTVMTQVSGGRRFPEQWLFGRGANTNKASASEMAEPTLRQMKRRQKYVTFMFRQMINFLIQQKINKGILDKNSQVSDYPFSVIIPEASKKEAGTIAEAFSKMAPALATATNSDFLSNETATKVLTTFIEQFGVEVNLKDELEKVKENPDLQAQGIQEAIKKYTEKVYGKKDG
jgi:hypothetical protein